MMNECIDPPSTRAMLIEAAVHSVLILRQARAMLIEVVARRSQCLILPAGKPCTGAGIPRGAGAGQVPDTPGYARADP